MRIFIMSKDAGAVIGKGGETIKRLRSEFDASVQLPDSPGPERILTIAAPLGSACAIVRDVMPNFDGGKFKDADTDAPTELRFLIHASQAGCIIGRAGSKIKDLRAQTGCNIKVFSEVAPQSTERVVQLNGKMDEITTCLSYIYDMLINSPPKGATQQYNPANFDEYFSHEYGGYTQDDNGRRGGGRGGGRGGRGGGDRFGPPRDGGGRGGGGYRGGRGGGDRDRNGGRDRGYGGGGDRYGGGGGDRFGGGGGRGSDEFGFPPQRGFNDPLMAPLPGSLGMADDSGVRSLVPPHMGDHFGGGMDQPTTSNKVSIPKDLAGAIIGKGGSRIKQIRMESGAHIQIDDPAGSTGNSNDRIITITGSQDQIQNAQYLLQISVKQSLANKY